MPLGSTPSIADRWATICDPQRNPYCYSVAQLLTRCDTHAIHLHVFFDLSRLSICKLVRLNVGSVCLCGCLIICSRSSRQQGSEVQVRLQAVDEVLQVLGQNGAQQVACPSWHYQDQGKQAQPSGSESAQQLPLSEALTKCYDLRSASPLTA